MPSSRRECPTCGGYFLLDRGTARCPHCGQCVTVPGTSSKTNRGTVTGIFRQALAEKQAYWEAEIAEIEVEFGVEVAKLLKTLI